MRPVFGLSIRMLGQFVNVSKSLFQLITHPQDWISLQDLGQSFLFNLGERFLILEQQPTATLELCSRGFISVALQSTPHVGEGFIQTLRSSNQASRVAFKRSGRTSSTPTSSDEMISR